MSNTILVHPILDLGDRVHIDEDESITARVIGVAHYTHGTDVRISWVHNGAVQDVWVDDWRLTKRKDA